MFIPSCCLAEGVVTFQLIKVVIYVFMFSHEVSGNSELMLKLSITVAFEHKTTDAPMGI